MSVPTRGLQITSTVTKAGTVELGIGEADVRAPAADEVVVRIEAVPVNPSDVMTLLAGGDLTRARFDGSRVTLPLEASAAQRVVGRTGLALTMGLEGAGVVVAAGDNAHALLQKKVAVMSMSAGLYAQYRTVRAEECVVLPEDASVEDGAAMFVNPLTALAIAETTRIEGYAGLIHTAAASNLGQMLVKICRDDGLPLVNVVRKQEHVELLRELGAKYVCNSSLPSFRDDLMAAIRDSGAMVAFDAIGGGRLASDLLAAMEAVAASRLPANSAYGSFERKQVYIYGHLDPSETRLAAENYGLIWGVSGWLMPPILERVGPQRAAELRQRVVRELKTTFASRFTARITLDQVLQREVMLAYARQATGEKYLITPNA